MTTAPLDDARPTVRDLIEGLARDVRDVRERLARVEEHTSDTRELARATNGRVTELERAREYQRGRADAASSLADGADRDALELRVERRVWVGRGVAFVAALVLAGVARVLESL